MTDGVQKKLLKSDNLAVKGLILRWESGHFALLTRNWSFIDYKKKCWLHKNTEQGSKL